MHGNVREWCADWYARAGPEAATDPTGPPSGTARVYRGGGWRSLVPQARSAYRNAASPSDRSFWIGFRVAAGGGK